MDQDAALSSAGREVVNLLTTPTTAARNRAETVARTRRRVLLTTATNTRAARPPTPMRTSKAVHSTDGP
ncbi:hypothetical protein [Nonomuraea sp. NPDC003804]|uniref:hypothetical protein n=1 Tax=Nonomuraea sp. NPDC003804 TaxID=3154547 RepID=UPI0033A7051E